MKRRVRHKIRTYDVVLEAVEAGVAYGWNRAHKHAENPSPDTVRADIEREVMNSLCEVLDFGDDE